MNRLLQLIWLALVACTACVAGCATSQASMDARYEASLLRWQGAPVADLVAAWGKPTLAQATPDGQVLTWTVRIDSDDRTARNAAPLYTTAEARNAGGGPSVKTVSPSMPTSAQVPLTCTTHFTIRDGRVASWKFEGLGCGAPT